jgi:hypothetical protein
VGIEDFAMIFPAGFKTIGLVCRHCEQGFPVLDDPKAVPPEFEAECPHCLEKEMYRKDEIQNLVVAGK